MPIRYHIDRERGVAFVEGDGKLDDEDLDSFAKRVTADPEYFSGVDELIDLSRAEPGSLTTEGIRRVAEIFRSASSSTNVKVAIVAPSDAGFGLSRMYHALRGDEPTTLEIFRSIDEARRWLGLDADPSEE